MKFLSRWEEPAYAALRIVAGLLFLFHGAQKVLGWHAVKAPPAVFSQLWVGGVIELVGGALLAIGLFTRYAAFVCSGTMAVAYLQFHWKLELDGLKWVPLVNRGELAVLYCFVFLFIAARGPGALGGPAARAAGGLSHLCSGESGKPHTGRMPMQPTRRFFRAPGLGNSVLRAPRLRRPARSAGPRLAFIRVMQTRGSANVRNVATGLVVTGAAIGGALAFWVARRKRRDDPARFRASDRLQPESVELPIGRTADRRPDQQSVKSGPPRPASSGVGLLDDVSRHSGVYQARFRYEGDVELTARPHDHAHRSLSGDDFDSVGPEDLGSAFLARATDSITELDDDDIDDLSEIPDFQLSTTMSEASSDAAHLPDEDADLQPDSPLEEAPEDEEKPAGHPSSDLPDEVLADVFDRPELSSHR